MAGNILIGSDWHLRHHKAAEWRGFSSTDSHDNCIVKKALLITQKRDVWILCGDIVFTSIEYFDSLIEKHCKEKWLEWNPGDNLPFDIIVVGGNHDRNNIQDSKYIKAVVGCRDQKFDGKRYIITHIPVHPNAVGRWEANIHGHMHQKFVIDPATGNPDPRYINVCFEQVGPLIALSQLIRVHEHYNRKL